MKNFIISLSFLTQLSLVAQVNPPQAPAPPTPPSPPSMPEKVDPKPSDNGDTTRFKVGEREIIIINKKEESKGINKKDEEDDDEAEIDSNDDNNKSKDKKNHHHKENMKPGKNKNKAADVGFLDLDLGVNVLSSPSSLNAMDEKYLNLKFWSWSTTLNFLPTKIYLGSKNVRLMTAFGWRIGKYKFDSPVDFIPKQDLQYNIDTTIRTSKLTIHHLQIPLMLYVQSNKIKGLGRLGIGFGGYVGVNVHEESNVSYQNINRKTETEESFGFDKYRYGLSGRVDVGPFKLFANMDMNKTWKSKDFKTLECGLWFDF